MREIPSASGEGSAYVPNLEAALMACFGGSDISGRLPVNIPALDENYQMTDEILYERGEGIR
jgi:beta-N-acetylhexosaminidase